MKHIVGLSGGKDSTAMALRLAEVEPRDYIYICTPTGNELPVMNAHWRKCEELLGKPLIRVTNEGRTLTDLIQIMNAVPNFRQRWCTRMLKIEPTIAYCIRNAPAINYVGLRADEPEDERGGIYGDKIQSDYPMRRWGWTVRDVWRYLSNKGIDIPERTDCAWCYHQRIGEWKKLWAEQPELYAEGAALERARGHSFRSPKRDTWPAFMDELGEQFASGRKVIGENRQGIKCRACSL